MRSAETRAVTGAERVYVVAVVVVGWTCVAGTGGCADSAVFAVGSCTGVDLRLEVGLPSS